MRWRSWCAAAAYVLASGLTGCGACGDPEDLVVDDDPMTTVTINWKESNAMGLYFTEPTAELPDGPDSHVKGKVYWVVEATKFPNGFSGPVTYGALPGDAKDATEEHGGGPGPARLECGVEYKVAIVALGGSVERVVSWSCPPPPAGGEAQ
jgi:hypothetical protein